MSIQDMSRPMLEEFMHFMTGKKIGSGMTREVYEHAMDPTKVIKVEVGQGHFQNVVEWTIWNDFKFAPKVRKWLAPCHYISPYGTFLIMDRVVDLPQGRTPKKLPAFLTDHKTENFGLLGNRVVCRDYGKVIIDLDEKQRKWTAANS